MNDPEVPAFISTDAGGLGLNLQVASFIDQSRPALEPGPRRAANRTRPPYRADAVRERNQHDCTATIEQRVLEVLYHKQEPFDELLDVDLDPETGTLITDIELPTDRLRHIVELLMAK